MCGTVQSAIVLRFSPLATLTIIFVHCILLIPCLKSKNFLSRSLKYIILKVWLWNFKRDICKVKNISLTTTSPLGRGQAADSQSSHLFLTRIQTYTAWGKGMFPVASTSEFTLVLLFINHLLFSTWTTVNLLLPHLVWQVHYIFIVLHK